MKTTKENLKEYIKLKKEQSKLGDQIVVLINNGVEDERLDKISNQFKELNTELNYLSRKFIDEFILD